MTTHVLNLRTPITTAADDSFEYFFQCFSEKIRLMFQVNPLHIRENKTYVSSESSAMQRIHMKHQALFSSKDMCGKNKCRLL